MLKLLRNNKGMTITEIITALAILGIISIPLVAVFSNSVFIINMTGNQLEINAAMQVAKASVVQAVKNSDELCDFSDDSKKIKLNPSKTPRSAIYDSPGSETAEFIKLEGPGLTGGTLADKYKYKVKFESFPAPDIVRLTIKLYTVKEKYLSELMIETSSRDFQ